MTYSLVSSSYANYTALRDGNSTYLDLISTVIATSLTSSGVISPATINYSTSSSAELPSATGTATSAASTSPAISAALSSTANLPSDLTRSQFDSATLSSTPASTSAVGYTAGASATLSSEGVATSQINGNFSAGAALTSAPALTTNGFVSRPTTAALASTAGIPFDTLIDRPTTAALAATPGQSATAVRTVLIDSDLVASAPLLSDVTTVSLVAAALSATPSSTSTSDIDTFVGASLSSTAETVSSIDVFSVAEAVLTSTPSSTSDISSAIGISSSLTSIPSSVPSADLVLPTTVDLTSSAQITSESDRLAVIDSALLSTATIYFTAIRLYSDLAGQLPSYAALVAEIPSYDNLLSAVETISSSTVPTEIASIIVVDAGILSDSLADLTAAPVLTADAGVQEDTDAALSSSASVNSDALVERTVTADLSSDPSITSATDVTGFTASTLAVSPTLVCDAIATASASAILSSTATMRAVSVRSYDETVTAYSTYETLLAEVADYENLAKGLIFEITTDIPSAEGTIFADTVRTHFSGTDGTVITAEIVASIDGGVEVASILSATPGSTADVTPTRLTDAALSVSVDLTAASAASQSISAELTATGTIRSTTVDEYVDLEVSYGTYAVLLDDVVDYQGLLVGLQSRSADVVLGSTSILDSDLSVIRSTTAALSATPELTSDALPAGSAESALTSSPELSANAALHLASSTELSATASLRTVLVTTYDDVLSGYPTYSELSTEVPQYATLLTGFQTRTGDATLSATADLQVDSVYEQLTHIDFYATTTLTSTVERGSLLDTTLTSSSTLSADIDRVAVADATIAATGELRPAIVNSYIDVADSYPDYAALNTEVQTYAALTLDYKSVAIDSTLTASSNTFTDAVFETTVSADFSATGSIRTGRPDSYLEVDEMYGTYDVLLFDVQEYFWLERNSGITTTIEADLSSTADLVSVADALYLASADLAATASVRTGYHQSYSDIDSGYPTYTELVFDVGQYSWLTGGTGFVFGVESIMVVSGTLRINWELPATYQRLTFLQPDYQGVELDYATYQALVSETEIPSTPSGNPPLSYWDGSTWRSGTLRYAADSSASDGTLNYWDGSQWIPTA